MKDLEMKITITLATVATMLIGISAVAQQDGETPLANDTGKITYPSTAGGYGDLASSHAYEMSAVVCEIDGKLSSKTAKVGDRVVLRTTDKIVTADGTQIPRGTSLEGHVTEVEAYDPDVGPARIAIAFDRADLKRGQSIAIFALIRGLRPAGAANADQPSDIRMVGVPDALGAQVNGGRMSPDYGTIAARERTGTETNRMDYAGDTSAQENAAADAGALGTTAKANGDANGHTGAHELAAARAVPHATDMPGVMLAGNSSSSGVLLGPIKDIQLENGAQFLLGIAENR